MIQPLLRLLLLTIGLLLTGSVAADSHTGRETYTIPGHGRLIMDVPTEWQATFYEPQDESFPVVFFYPLKGQPATFHLSVAVLWSNDPLTDLTHPETLRGFIEGVGQSVLSQADQDTLELEAISGRTGEGYVFDLTDKDAGPEEYTDLTQGGLAVGEVVVIFSLLTRENHQTLRQLTLEMLNGARQDHSRRDVHLRRRPAAGSAGT